MIQITPQMRVVVAVEPADFRRGIDGLARLCKEVLQLAEDHVVSSIGFRARLGHGLVRRHCGGGGLC